MALLNEAKVILLSRSFIWLLLPEAPSFPLVSFTMSRLFTIPVSDIDSDSDKVFDGLRLEVPICGCDINGNGTVPEKLPIGAVLRTALAYRSSPRFIFCNSSEGVPRGIGSMIEGRLEAIMGVTGAVERCDAGKENPEEIAEVERGVIEFVVVSIEESIEEASDETVRFS